MLQHQVYENITVSHCISGLMSALGEWPTACGLDMCLWTWYGLEWPLIQVCSQSILTGKCEQGSDLFTRIPYRDISERPKELSAKTSGRSGQGRIIMIMVSKLSKSMAHNLNTLHNIKLQITNMPPCSYWYSYCT